MNIQKIKKDFIRALDEHEYDSEYTYDAVSEIVEQSLERKAPLIELFRKHPNWDEDQLCIHFDADIERKIDNHAYGAFLRWLWRAAAEQLEVGNTIIDEQKNPLRRLVHEWTKEESSWGGGESLYDALCEIPAETIIPEQTEKGFSRTYMRVFEWFSEIDQKLSFRPGMKLNRVVNKICAYYGLDKLDGYDREFARFSDGITPLKISRHTTISVNPVDFLLMSNGNSWRSCHYIGDDPGDAGCYCSGTVSYMMSEHAFIVSIIDKEWQNDNLAFAPKINRQVFGYNDHQLLQSRLYPQDCDRGALDTYKNLREMVEEIIASAEGEANRWVRMKDFNTSSYGTAYTDWCYYSFCGQYVLRPYQDADKEKIVMSRHPLCIHCGQTHSKEEALTCEECEAHYCEDCGCRIDLDDGGSYVVDEDGYYYCTDCRFRCQKCDSIERVVYRVWISDIDEDWCKWCANNYASQCTNCGEYVSEPYAIDANGETVCEGCCDCFYDQCEDCGELFQRDLLTEIDGKLYCETCREDHEEEGEDCA